MLAERPGRRGHHGCGVATPEGGQDAELVAAKAVGGRAPLGHLGIQRARQSDQQGVAGGVAKGVVVGLEAVEVEQQQQQRPARAGAPQATFQVELELAPIADPGQGVGQRGGDQDAVVGQEGDGRQRQQHERHHDDGDRPAAHAVQRADRGAGDDDDVPVVVVAMMAL
jgi:hypothetical protein